MIKPSVFVTRRWPAAVEAKLAEDYNVVLNTGDKPLSPAEIRESIKTYDAVLPTVTDTLNAEALDVPKAQARISATMVSATAISASLRPAPLA
jgi:glyoxylate reductase